MTCNYIPLVVSASMICPNCKMVVGVHGEQAGPTMFRCPHCKAGYSIEMRETKAPPVRGRLNTGGGYKL